MNTETDPRNESDRKVFRQIAIMLAVWTLLLVLAGVLLIVFGGGLMELVN